MAGAFFCDLKRTQTTHCKINLLLNVVGQREDGFHELEMLMLPVPIFDRLEIELIGEDIELTCNQPGIPPDSGNLIWRAAEQFLATIKSEGGVRIHLDKKIPAEGGLGGGSGNAAGTLLALNDLHDQALDQAQLHEIAAGLGSDVPFFLQSQVAVAKGRGEIIEPTGALTTLDGKVLLLARPGFGVSTPWAYKNLAKFPEAKNCPLGQADELAKCLSNCSLSEAVALFYNSLELPAFDKYPLLKLMKEHALTNGADVALMCGSGSTIFAICPSASAAQAISQAIESRFGTLSLNQTVELPGRFTAG
jgi:4-diphosphocytidyl-2-C-methyl-D-erythritol kinase